MNNRRSKVREIFKMVSNLQKAFIYVLKTRYEFYFKLISKLLL